MTGFEPAASSSRKKSLTWPPTLGSPRENLLDPQTEKGHPTRFAPLLTRKHLISSKSHWVQLEPVQFHRNGMDPRGDLSPSAYHAAACLFGLIPEHPPAS